MISATRHIALCCLLTLATSASAEGAWVLWSQELAERKMYPWNPIDASATEAGCRRAVKKEIEKARRRFDNPANFFAAGEDFYSATVPSTHDEGTARNVMSLLCLPDTVDPRGPKGK